MAALLAAGSVAPGCSAPDSGARIDPVGPDRATWKPVVNALGRRCGSIDCHGSRFRNFRVYGYGGQRLDPADRPDTPKSATDAEADATYDSFIALEPELMREVVDARGAGATRLTAVRKGRGEEAHEGGRRITPGDDADLCLLGWIAGGNAAEACARVLDQP